MNWNQHIQDLKNGKNVTFKPKGNSMKGKVESGQACTVTPVKEDDLKVGDVVLCKVNGHHYLHLIKKVRNKQFQIGNNKGRINGWVSFNGIYGRLKN